MRQIGTDIVGNLAVISGVSGIRPDTGTGTGTGDMKKGWIFPLAGYPVQPFFKIPFYQLVCWQGQQQQ